MIATAIVLAEGESMTQKIESIQDWLIRHGHHPADTVNGEPLLDLLWNFWVDSINERTKIREGQGDATPGRYTRDWENIEERWNK
jgi:hypothetical protein